MTACLPAYRRRCTVKSRYAVVWLKAPAAAPPAAANAASGSPPAGEDDGLGVFVSSAASMTCCVFLPSSTTPEITLFSQPTERAGTHAGAWKQDVSPAPEGGCGGHPPHIARARATDSSHTSHRLLGGVSRRRCPSHTVACLFAAMLCCATALGRSHT